MNEEDLVESKTSNNSYTKEKIKNEVKGNIKLLKVYRNSRAELRIWPSSRAVMKSFTNNSFEISLINRERVDY